LFFLEKNPEAEDRVARRNLRAQSVLMRLRQQTPSHTGSLLVALPTLLDPNFRRTILFLSHHDTEQGSVGFILNRPCQISLGDLAPTEGSDRIPVYEGGPVDRKSLIVAKIHWHQHEGLARFQSFGEEDLASRPKESGADHGELRAFTGYAGWSAGQLERELEEKSWIILPPTPDLLLAVETPEEGTARWRSLMKKLGPWYHLMALTPDDPKLN
jgi:putative transcriptional regulator